MSASLPLSSSIPSGLPRLPAPTGTESRAFDDWAIRTLGVPEATLMENAGRSAALVLDHLFPSGPVVAVAGGGNNGGDAVVLARTLASWGREVSLVMRAEDRFTGLRHGWTLPAVDFEEIETVLGGDAVVVDGLLGTGLSGAPRAEASRLIEIINRSERPVLSLDVPSGVDADRGLVPGACVRAQVTVAFGWPKAGTLFHPARLHVGRLVAVEIGFPPPPHPFVAEVATPEWARAALPKRRPDTHKNEVGALTLLAGRPGMAGAAVLAARAALRTGVGLVRVISDDCNREILQSALPEAIFVSRADPEAVAEAVARADALVAGPGIGVDEAGAESLRTLIDLRAGRPLLLDADALTLAGEGRVSDLAILAARGPLLLTPHAGEMARIASVTSEEASRDRSRVCLEAAASFGAAVLLKGTPSVVADPEGRLRIDSMGTSDLAVAGMGDVLAGVAGSLLAQALPPAAAGSLGLVLSGLAARLAGRGRGTIPEDVIEHLPDALAYPLERSALPFAFVVFDQEPVP